MSETSPTSLLQAARDLYSEILSIETKLLQDRDALLDRAWNLGAILSALKDQVGHGKWLFWLGANWEELGDRNARRCMAFFADNPTPELKTVSNRWNSTDLKHVLNETTGEVHEVRIVHPTDRRMLRTGFTDDSIRKFMWGYIPAKERPQLAGDQSVSHPPSYLTVVNHFAKFDRQLRLAGGEAPIEDMRRDFEPMIRRQIELLGRDWFEGLLRA